MRASSKRPVNTLVTDADGFVAASTVDEAVAALGYPGAVAVGGGTSIGLMIGQGLISPPQLVWLGQIPELREISDHGDRLVVGAGVTLEILAAHSVVTTRLAALATAAAAVGNTRIRAVATVGGALAHADPRQDLPPALLALGAEVEVAGPGGNRLLAVADLATGFMTTVLQPDEIVTHVSIPLVEAQRSQYHRFTAASLDDYPTVSVAVAVVVDRNDIVTRATVAVGGAAATAYLVDEAATLVGTRGASAALNEVADAAARRAQPIEDRLGSVAYKREMVRIWTSRALSSCLGPAAPASDP